MDNIEFIDTHEISFFSTLIREFKRELNELIQKDQIVIINDGILKCEDFLFWIWVHRKDSLLNISYIENHEGIWNITVVYSDYSDSFIRIIKRFFKYQALDYTLNIQVK